MLVDKFVVVADVYVALHMMFIGIYANECCGKAHCTISKLRCILFFLASHFASCGRFLCSYWMV